VLWSGASPEKNSLGPFTFGYPPLLALKTRTIIQLQGTRPQHRPRNRSSDQDDRKPNFAQPRSQPRMLAAQLSEAQIDRDSRNQVPPLSLERSEDAQEAKLLAGRMGGPGIERRWLRRAARPQPEKSFAYDGHRISQDSIGELLQMGVMNITPETANSWPVLTESTSAAVHTAVRQIVSAFHPCYI